MGRRRARRARERRLPRLARFPSPAEKCGSAPRLELAFVRDRQTKQVTAVDGYLGRPTAFRVYEASPPLPETHDGSQSEGPLGVGEVASDHDTNAPPVVRGSRHEGKGSRVRERECGVNQDHVTHYVVLRGRNSDAESLPMDRRVM